MRVHSIAWLKELINHGNDGRWPALSFVLSNAEVNIMTDKDPPVEPVVTREELHFRRIDMRGWQRSDGLYEVEGHITDFKPHDFKPPNGDKVVPAGQAVHDMGVTLVYDDAMRVHEVRPFMNSAPYDVCFGAPETLQTLKGLSIASGWSSEVRKRLSGSQSCNHLMGMLIPMAATAYQTLTVKRGGRVDAVKPDGSPAKIGTCFAYAPTSPVVLYRWPNFYTGPRPEAVAKEGA